MQPFDDLPLASTSMFPEHAASLRRGRARGELWSPLPGVFAPAGVEEHWALRAQCLGGEVIDRALRQGAATLTELHDALELIPGRPGMAEVRRLLHESRDEPWSPLERRAHRALRKARISGYRTNHEVRIHGKAWYIDIAFPRHMLAIEIDGFDFHNGPAAMDADRIKQNALVGAGWTVLRYTSRTMDTLTRDVLSYLSR